MRKYTGMIIVLMVWAGFIIGTNIWFSIHPEASQINAIVSAVYIIFLLSIIPIGLPLHSRTLEILLMLYALVLGIVDVAKFLRMDQMAIQLLDPIVLQPFEGLFYFENMIALGSFAVHAVIGCFAAFLVFAAGVGACMVQPRE